MKKNFKKLLSLLLIFSMLLSITPVQEVSAKTAKKPKLSSSKVELKVGSSKTIKLKNYTKLSKAKIKKVKWTSSKKGVLSIKTSGKYKQNCKITAKKSGSTTLKLKYNNKTYKCTVKVSEKKSTEQSTTEKSITTEQKTTENKTTETTTKTEHQHEYTEWYTTKAVSCTEYGAEERVCRTCGDKQQRSIEPTGHNWGEYEVLKNATCTEEGIKVKECNLCNIKEELKIKPTGHEMGDYVIRESTCKVAGSKYRQCKNCSYSESENLPLAEHKYSSWNTVKEPTCTETGRKTRLCSTCLHSEDETIPQLEHDWVVISNRESTCKIVGQRVKKCNLCGETKEEDLPLKEHSFGDWYVSRKATCTEAGNEIRYCSCGEYELRDIPATGVHNEVE